jgi:ADP-heptose:LPS heptosyltransferase
MTLDKILFVRRDNIGDLVCTTPAIHAVRQAFPRARLAIVVNTYTADLIRSHPDLDEVYVLEKPKHAPGKSKLPVLWDNLRVFKQIRRERYDAALGCGLYSPTLARYTLFTGAQMRVGYVRGRAGRLCFNRPLPEPPEPQHEVVRVFNLLAPLGITGEPGDLVLPPDAEAARQFAKFKKEHEVSPAKPLLALAISARLEANKWPLSNFIALMDRILAAGRAQILLLWAPGSRHNPTYPGEDEAAAEVLAHFRQGVLAYPTPTLKDLVAALAGADLALTLDTGSLHLAAAAKKPTVALMTDAKAPDWFPWKTQSRVVTARQRVAEIPVSEVWDAVNDLLNNLGAPSP